MNLDDRGKLTDHVSLGVLTRIVPRYVVDEVIAETGRVEKRRDCCRRTLWSISCLLCRCSPTGTKRSFGNSFMVYVSPEPGRRNGRRRPPAPCLRPGPG